MCVCGGGGSNLGGNGLGWSTPSNLNGCNQPHAEGEGCEEPMVGRQKGWCARSQWRGAEGVGCEEPMAGRQKRWGVRSQW